jgi:hypothetical protein
MPGMYPGNYRTIMPQSTPRRHIERPPNKIAGIVYILIGFMALGTCAFVLLYQNTVAGPSSNTWVGFGIVIAVYGLFRIYTGISTIRRANKLNDTIHMNGESSNTRPPVS